MIETTKLIAIDAVTSGFSMFHFFPKEKFGRNQPWEIPSNWMESTWINNSKRWNHSVFTASASSRISNLSKSIDPEKTLPVTGKQVKATNYFCQVYDDLQIWRNVGPCCVLPPHSSLVTSQPFWPTFSHQKHAWSRQPYPQRNAKTSTRRRWDSSHLNNSKLPAKKTPKPPQTTRKHCPGRAIHGIGSCSTGHGCWAPPFGKKIPTWQAMVFCNSRSKLFDSLHRSWLDSNRCDTKILRFRI